jgi:hypothetical protein
MFNGKGARNDRLSTAKLPSWIDTFRDGKNKMKKQPVTVYSLRLYEILNTRILRWFSKSYAGQQEKTFALAPQAKIKAKRV